MRRSLSANETHRLQRETMLRDARDGIEKRRTLGSQGVFDEDGNILSEPWNEAMLWAPAIDEEGLKLHEQQKLQKKLEQVIFHAINSKLFFVID